MDVKLGQRDFSPKVYEGLPSLNWVVDKIKKDMFGLTHPKIDFSPTSLPLILS